MNNEVIKNYIGFIREEAILWCKGKSWSWRFLILVWFAYVLVKHLSDPMYTSILGALNLGIHELGHVVLNIFGAFIGVMGGTLLEILAPIFSVYNFYRQNDFFAIALSFGWLSTSLFDVARYVADARAMELPLYSLFGNENVIHDWNYLLSRVGLLQQNLTLAIIFKIIATISMVTSLLFGAWLLWQMKKTSSVPDEINK